MGGGGSKSIRHMRNYMIGEAQDIKKKLLGDPMLKKSQQYAMNFMKYTKLPQRDRMGMAMSEARYGAERAVSEGLAGLAGSGRGGSFDALSMGAETRSGAGLAGLKAGNEMEMAAWEANMNRRIQASNLLNQVMAQKYGVLTGLMAGQAPVLGAAIGATGQMESAKWDAAGNFAALLTGGASKMIPGTG